ncbi:MAG: HK97 gp10 family phage protein [Firmicutes bacterium]|nr:HK97 gp10 family phage protein [Bacillota bacterium]
MDNEIDGLIKNFTDVIDKSEDAVKLFMKKEAQKERRRMLAAAKRKVKKVTGNYFKGFKVGKKVYSYPDAEYNIRVYNSAPHGHLIENGFRLTIGGKFIRWMPGKHIMEEVHRDFESEYAADVENELVNFVCRELEK